MSALAQPITIRAAIKFVRIKQKKNVRQLVLSCGKGDAGRIARLSLFEGIAFEITFVELDHPDVTIRAEIGSIDTRMETSDRTITLDYSAEDALRVGELSTREQIEFLVSFKPADVVKRKSAAPARDAAQEI